MLTFDGASFWTRDEVIPRIAHTLQEQRASMYGPVTKTRGGRKIDIDVPIFGLWAGLTVLFPSAILNPTIGSRVFGSTDKALVLHAKNQDRLTIHNARLTGLANLRLAAGAEIFSGTARFTGLLKNNAAPTDANSFFTYDTAAFVDSGFAMTNFKGQAWTGAWGARTGFTAMQTQAGWGVDWQLTMEEDVVDGLGAVDMFITGFGARISSIPVGPTAAQIESNLFFQGTGAAVGSGIHESVDDLVLTCGTASVTAKSAALIETGFAFAPSKKRIGETVWETVRGFSTGVPQALATVA
jgi:hypothetical protein